MIVAIEGIDASGKETQVRMLKNWGLAHGNEVGFDDVAEQDFPDYTNITGGKIGELLRGEWAVIHNDHAEKEYTKALAMQCLMVTNRLEHGALLKSYEHDRSKLLILDRYHASGQVYGRSDGLSPQWLTDIHAILPSPDLLIFLDITVDESFRRRPERLDYYERNRTQLEEVRKLYHELFFEERTKQQPRTPWFIIDGSGKVEDVHEKVKQILLDLIRA